MITVYGCPHTRSLRAVWALEEAATEYQYKKIDLFGGEGRQPAFLAINPAGKIPVLKDDSQLLKESGAIGNYIGAKFPESGLVPQTLTERGLYDQWCFFALNELEQPLWTMVRHTFLYPEEKRVAAILEIAAWEYQRALKQLSEGLGDRAFLVGDNFTYADILVAQILMWGSNNKLPLEQENLQEYLKRCKARPTFAKARSVEAE